MSARLQTLLDDGVESGVFPCAWAAVLVRGECVFEGGAGGATARTVFDLASLTKVMATTAAFVALWAEGTVAPGTPVSQLVPDFAPGGSGVCLEDLLCHRSGLPAFVPFFAAALRAYPRLLDRDCPANVRAIARRMVVDRAISTPPVEPPRVRTTYSDVGFIVLGEALARAGAAPLDTLFVRHVADPLRLRAGFRRLSAVGAGGPEVTGIAPTGTTRPREPAPGQEGLWAAFPEHSAAPGEVDDDNAWAMDGVAGHAGLFGSASDVAAFGQAVLDEMAGGGRIAPQPLWERALRRDVETTGSTRALGFDTRLPGDNPVRMPGGRYIGARPPGAVGHVGFTGVSLWIDRGRTLVVALCTNRTALGRGETRIRAFRPRFHDAVIETLGLV